VTAVGFSGTGTGYIPGEIKVLSTATGAGFTSRFYVDATGVIDTDVNITNHGAGYSLDAVASFYYTGTDVRMTSSITELTTNTGGADYIDGSLMTPLSATNDFSGSFTVTSGVVSASEITAHGFGYTSLPSVVLTYPASILCALDTSMCKVNPTPYTLHPTPYTLHPTPYTLHPTPYTLHPTPFTLHPKPQPPNPKPQTLNPKP